MSKAASQRFDVPSAHNGNTDETGTRPGRPRSQRGRFRVEATDEQHPKEFAAAACQCLDGKLLRCEERYPDAGSHSVLYIVVEHDAEHCREKLLSLHEEYFGRGLGDPLAPVRLEVIDRSADEAVERLINVGLVARTLRAFRTLWPVESASVRPLSRAELEGIVELRERAARKIKMVRVLQDAGLDDEARAALLEALSPLGRALALEKRWPEPVSLHETLLPPVSSVWKGALPFLRSFSTEGGPPCQSLLNALGDLVQGNSTVATA